MSTDSFDLLVIGGGSGGVRAARLAGERGMKVAIIEADAWGGTCVNRGCVPKKLLVQAAHFAEDFEDAAGFGWSVEETTFDWGTLRRGMERYIRYLNGIYVHLLERSGVNLFQGHATLEGPHQVAVNGRLLQAEHILIATGSEPVVPEVPGHELAITSDQAFTLPSLPDRVAIVGGGYIAVEFAGIFHGLGSRTTLCYRGPLFLRGFDRPCREHLAAEMRHKGIGLRFDCRVRMLERRDDGIRLHFEEGGELVVDQVLYATGREPRTRGLGLERIGVALDDYGAIEVDEFYRSSVPSIHAIGDIINRGNLTPVALAEAAILIADLNGERPEPLDYETIPTAVFSQPALAAVGLTEEAAREQHRRVRVFSGDFRPLRHGLSGRSERSLVRLVVDEESDRVLGAHMVAPEAPEILQGLAIAVRAGLTKAQIDATIGIHPTAAEEFVSLR